MAPRDGGPAYPVESIGFAVGMSLRDWFAGQALTGGFHEFLTAGNAWDSYEDFAKSCYLMADAMLAVREAK